MTHAGTTIVRLPSPPKKTYSFRLPEHIWDELSRVGAATKRSRSNLIEIALEEFFRKHGDVMSRSG